jgi:hypothetical protein
MNGREKMDTKQCPKCGKVSAASTIQCVCGYDLFTVEMKPSPTSESGEMVEPIEKEEKDSYKGWIRLIIFLLVLVSFLAPWAGMSDYGYREYGWTLALEILVYSLGICCIPYVALFIFWILAIIKQNTRAIELGFLAILVVWLLIVLVVFALTYEYFVLEESWGALMFFLCIALAIISEIIFVVLERRQRKKSI